MGKLRSETPPMVKWIRMLVKNESHYVVFRAGKKHGKRPEYFGEVPNIFFFGQLWKSKKGKTWVQKPLWAKWLRMLGITGVTTLFFTLKNIGNDPNTLGKSQIISFLVTSEKSEKSENAPSKTHWAKWLRMLGENGGHHVIFHTEKHGKYPENLEKVKKNVFLGILLYIHH